MKEKYTFDDLPEYLVPIEHSALGTSWAKTVHKYIKKIGNKYYYDTRTLKNKLSQKAANAESQIQGKKAAVKAAGGVSNYISGKAKNTASSVSRKATSAVKTAKAKALSNGTVRSAKNTAKKLSDVVSTAATKVGAKTAVASRKAKNAISKTAQNMYYTAKRVTGNATKKVSTVASTAATRAGAKTAITSRKLSAAVQNLKNAQKSAATTRAFKKTANTVSKNIKKRNASAKRDATISAIKNAPANAVNAVKSKVKAISTTKKFTKTANTVSKNIASRNTALTKDSLAKKQASVQSQRNQYRADQVKKKKLKSSR